MHSVTLHVIHLKCSIPQTAGYALNRQDTKRHDIELLSLSDSYTIKEKGKQKLQDKNSDKNSDDNDDNLHSRKLVLQLQLIWIQLNDDNIYRLQMIL